MRNTWNRAIYRLWSPLYDPLLARVFRPGRARAMELLAPRAGQRVLLPGVGTGADLELLPEGVDALGIDLSSAMLSRAQARLPLRGRTVRLLQGDVQELRDAASESFDAAVLNLILSVVPDPRACLRETLRALRPGGRVVVFDKFLHPGERGSTMRRLANVFSTVLGTDITRRFEDIAADAPCEIVADEPSIARGMYRVILLRKL